MATSLATRTRRLMGMESREGRRTPSSALPNSIGRWAPLIGGTLLAVTGITRRSPVGTAVAVAGGAVAYGGLTGQLPLPNWVRSRLPAQGDEGLIVERGFTIMRPREELFRFWRDFENLPRFMPHLQSVTSTGSRQSHWVTTGPAGTSVEWDAEIVEEVPNELIRWQSLPGSQISNRGEVRFAPAPADRGTEVRVVLQYDPPAGIVGATIAQLFGEGADRQVREGLRRFKSFMETGEVPTNDGQPMGHC